MNQIPKTELPRSLAQYFEAPGDFTGIFGWVCGYSADSEFMNQAAERFTRKTQGQRAHGGQAALALLLDSGNRCLTFCDVPGVVHLAIKDPSKQPFLLLHAKVAILGFRHPTDASQLLVRLIVSTGNWTCQTLEESLDLAWCVDVSSEDMACPDDSTVQACADFKAAAEMFDWLKPHFDTRLLDFMPTSLAPESESSAQGMFHAWLAKVVSQGRQVKPRFFTNTKASLLVKSRLFINTLDE